jgi:integrase
MRLPLVAEVRSLLDNATDEQAAAISLAAFAGLRAGEICGVQRADIDFLSRTLHVGRQVQPGPKGVPDIRPPKYGSERVIYLPDGLLGLLSRHVVGREGWLFVRKDGRPWNLDKINQWWPQVRDAAGATHVRLHDLRHFYASALIAEGCDVVTVQKALGHASATTTLTTYSHLWPKAEDRTRRAAGALFDAVAAASADSLRTGEGGAGL